MTPADETRIADAQLLANAVRQHASNVAYIHCGGSNGCALCQDRTFTQRLEAGHQRCAIEGIRWETAQQLAREIASEVWIPLYRTLQDPRIGARV